MSQSSPDSLKRRQPTISSFFQKPAAKPPQQSQPPARTEQPPARTQARTNTPGQNRIIPQVEDDSDEDEIVAPAPKRARSNKVRPAAPADDDDEDEDNEDKPAKKPVQETQPQDGTEKPVEPVKRDLAQFASSTTEDKDTDTGGSVCREKSALHEKFVKRLGGPDCLVGIGRGTGSAADVETVEGEDDDEDAAAPAPAPTKETKGKAKKLTPLEKQVVDIKRKHKDTILVVEVGYKFRFFGEDARTAAKELSIVCIPGKFRYDEHPSEAHLDKFASASIPVHRLHVHVKRLITAGHKVGVVRQVETAALKAAGDNRNAPFGRKLTNLYTKGTYIDDVEGLGPTPSPAAAAGSSTSTGHLLCITESNAGHSQGDEKVHVGIVAVQPGTGDVVYDDFEDGFMRSEIETRLLHIAPCELLIVGELSRATEKMVKHLSGSKLNVFGDQVRVERASKGKTAAAEAHSHVSSFYAEKMKQSHAQSESQSESQWHSTDTDLLQKVLELPEQVTICLSAMITHMTDYGLQHVFELTRYFQPFSARSHMLLNGNTLVSLEIYQNQTDHSGRGSLFWTLDRTHTRFGQRLLRKWVGRPLLDRASLEERVNAVEELTSADRAVAVERIKALLGKVKSDLERSLIRIYYGKCTRPELLTVLQTMQMLAQEFADVKTPADAGFASRLVSEAVASLPRILADVVFFLDKINMHAARTDDKYAFFRETEETDAISEQKLGIAGVEHELDEQRSAAGDKLGRKSPVEYTTVAGIEYLVEVENSSATIKRVPASWVKVSGTKKVSRFHSPEVIQLLRQRDQHKEALAAACDAAFTALLADISARYQPFRSAVQALATLDCLLSLASIASQPGYSKPEYTDEICIHVEQGRHPMVEQLLLDSYVPNDTSLASSSGSGSGSGSGSPEEGTDPRALLVTGPNMGGKSSYVRQVALIAIMGQIGSYVPARYARLGLLDAVFTRMGAFDNMLAGESTFMVELSETADVLKQASPRSLVILDELGRGTSTHDGVAIAQAVLDYMVREVRSLTLFITHYQHLANMARSYSGELRNVHMKFTEAAADTAASEGGDSEITFLYEVGEGVAHRSYGLNVARLANLPASLLDVARTKSAQLEEKIRRKRLGGLVSTVEDLLSGDDGVVERLLDRAGEL